MGGGAIRVQQYQYVSRLDAEQQVFGLLVVMVKTQVGAVVFQRPSAFDEVPDHATFQCIAAIGFELDRAGFNAIGGEYADQVRLVDRHIAWS
ncbi:hypothetical protein D3C81_1774520 [compost metagenome]